MSRLAASLGASQFFRAFNDKASSTAFRELILRSDKVERNHAITAEISL
jgi:hypothetical protein